MNCPNCHRINPPDALRCDCGYPFRQPQNAASDGGAAMPHPAGSVAGDSPGSPAPSQVYLPDVRITREMWRNFFHGAGGSILYCLSALSIVFGIARILGPRLAQSDLLRDVFPVIAALNGYEIALWGVLVFIVIRQHVTDDAISLVVIAALFLIGSGLTLSVVANTNPRVAIALGAGALALGMGKILVLRRFVGLPIGAAALGGMAVILVWNFGAGAVYSNVATTMKIGRDHWLLGELALLAGGVAVLWDAVVRAGGDFVVPDDGVPFLRRPAMGGIFTLILLIAAGVHQYVLGYGFDVKSCFGDYLPLVSVVSLLVLQLGLELRRRASYVEVGLALVPLAACGVAVMAGAVMTGAFPGIRWLWHPSVLLGLTGLGVLGIGLRGGHSRLIPVAAGYALAVVLTSGFSPDAPQVLHWYIAGSLLAAGMFIAGMVMRNVTVCFSAVALMTVGLAAAPEVRHIAESHHLNPAGLATGLGGLGTMGLAYFFGRRMPVPLLVGGALGVMAFLFDFTSGDPGWRDLAAAGGVALVGIPLWYRTRQWLPVAILAFPVVIRFWLGFARLSAWRFVILGFVLLFAGAWRSVWKGKRSRREGQIAELPESGVEKVKFSSSEDDGRTGGGRNPRGR
ncbi:MAG: hypothetical protein V1809_16490 [Planctomycetota bacterium]